MSPGSSKACGGSMLDIPLGELRSQYIQSKGTEERVVEDEEQEVGT